MAAAAVGETAVAAGHATRALELMSAWGIPLARTWFTGLREQFAF